jgi:hypothetical protein
MRVGEARQEIVRCIAGVVAVECALALGVCAALTAPDPALPVVGYFLLVGLWFTLRRLGALSRDQSDAALLARARTFRSVKGVMLGVAIIGLAFSPVCCALRGLADRNPPDFPGVMANLCTKEAEQFESRAAACRARAKNGDPWEESGEEVENLKLCPLPSDKRRRDSWLEQAAIWERAAARARKAAQRYQEL